MATKTSKLGVTAARGTLLSIALRLASFILSQATVRFVSAAALGKASVPLELLLGTALFVSREGFRLALTKDYGKRIDADAAKVGRHKQQQQMINVSWLSVPLGAIVSMFAICLHLRTCNNKVVSNSEYEALDYKVAGILYCLASFMESLSEPLVIRCLQQMDVTTKAKAEGVALVMKSVSCFGCLYIKSSIWAVSAFGISQFVYGLTFTTIMYRYGRSASGGILWPKRIVDSTTINPYRTYSGAWKSLRRSFDYQQLWLVLIFTLQGLFKHALTEADKIVLSALAESYDQGIYAIASSYGGLAARLLLQPIEENARLLFSRQGALLERDKQSDRTPTAEATTSKQIDDMQKSYSFLLRTVCLIGLLFATIAVNYTSILLRLLAGYQWGSNTEAIDALTAFCVYTSFLSLNGISEAFVYGVARSGRDVGRLSIVHALVGGTFAFVAPGLVANHGAVGLVAANCICMALRSLYSLYFALIYFSNDKTCPGIGCMFEMLPHPLVAISFAVSFVITRASRDYFYNETLMGKTWLLTSLEHIGVGVVCLCVTGAMTMWLERDIQHAIKALLKWK
jgi:oligosaccharide translocation protein RFT1